ncbi:MAG: hypothetical protein RSG59_00540 [Ruthenibacterium sp.]
MEQQKHLFGQTIAPACEYCAKSHVMQGGMSLHCDAADTAVSAYHHCERFSYDPLRRIPRRMPQMPVFSPEDFKL